jgi:hypothetical protein
MGSPRRAPDRRNFFSDAERRSRRNNAGRNNLCLPGAASRLRDGDGCHSPTDSSMTTETSTFPQVFPTWAELAAAAKAGDATARDFLLTFVPWMTALRDDKPKH